MNFVLISIELILIALTFRFMVSQYKVLRAGLRKSSKNSVWENNGYFNATNSSNGFQDYYNSILEKNNNLHQSFELNRKTFSSESPSSDYSQTRITSSSITPRMTIVHVYAVKAA